MILCIFENVFVYFYLYINLLLNYFLYIFINIYIFTEHKNKKYIKPMFKTASLPQFTGKVKIMIYNLNCLVWFCRKSQLTSNKNVYIL